MLIEENLGVDRRCVLTSPNWESAPLRPDFRNLPGRRVFGRNYASLGQWRRLGKQYEPLRAFEVTRGNGNVAAYRCLSPK